MNKLTLDVTELNCNRLEEICRACNMDSIDYWGCEGCQIGEAKYDIHEKLIVRRERNSSQHQVVKKGGE
jgi:hypothetical protein